MTKLTDIHELRRFLVMMNQSAKYIPRLAELTHPLRELLSKKNAWVWSPRQQHAFNAIKEKPSSTPALAIFDPALETSLSADASSYGLGAVMTRKQKNGNWKPVIFIPRALTATEIKGDKPRLKKRPLPLPGLVRYWQIILSESVSTWKPITSLWFQSNPWFKVRGKNVTTDPTTPCALVKIRLYSVPHSREESDYC